MQDAARSRVIDIIMAAIKNADVALGGINSHQSNDVINKQALVVTNKKKKKPWNSNKGGNNNKAKEPGECFVCHNGKHWARDCPIRKARNEAKSKNNNIVLTTTKDTGSDYLLEHKAKWTHLLPSTSISKDESWAKVVVHGIPLSVFNNEQGMDLMKEEISTFNQTLNLNVKGTPYWLTSKDRRQTQNAGSVVVAFATEAEANRAISNRLFIAGISVRVEKLLTVSPTFQCSRCQGFGHLEQKCKRPVACRICAKEHHTKEHSCPTCQETQTHCQHCPVKCHNCKGDHAANSRSCSILQGIAKSKSL